MMHPIELELTQVTTEGTVIVSTLEVAQASMSRTTISTIADKVLNTYTFNEDTMLWVCGATGNEFFAIDLHSPLPVQAELEHL